MRILSLFLGMALLFSNEAYASRGHFRADTWATRAKAKVLYFGGPVISQVKVYTVFWGPKVDPVTQSRIGDFYSSVTRSTYLDWVDEYHTFRKAVGGRPGTQQHIGRGSYGGAITIAPQNLGTKLDKKAVEAELELQIGAGKLPLPDADTLYMIHFPKGMTLTSGGVASCSYWCADHEGFVSQKFGNVYYAMMPDLGECGSSCAFASTPFDSLTIAASHELVEAITDPLCPDIGQSGKYPAAWLAKDQNEVGDLCAGYATDLKASSGTYKVQGEWDNQKGSCNNGPFSTR